MLLHPLRRRLNIKQQRCVRCEGPTVDPSKHATLARAGSMLAQRLRRRSNINPAPG